MVSDKHIELTSYCTNYVTWISSMISWLQTSWFEECSSVSSHEGGAPSNGTAVVDASGERLQRTMERSTILIGESLTVLIQ